MTTNRLDKPIVVLGMHNSGTTITAESFRKNGINMGMEVLSNCESKDFFNLNENILKSAGGSWDKPPPVSEILAIKEMNRSGMQSIIDGNSIAPQWGFKDPRTILTIGVYEDLLPEDTFYVCCFRDRKHVAASMVKDGKVKTLEEGEALAKEYNRRLIMFLLGKFCYE